MPELEPPKILRPPRKKAPSRFSELKRAEARLRAYEQLFSNLKLTIETITTFTPEHAPSTLLGRLEKGRDAAYRKYMSERKKTASVQTPRFSAAGAQSEMREYRPYQNVDAVLEWVRRMKACSAYDGVSRTRYLVPEVTIEAPSDDDTDWNYDAQFFDEPSGGYYSLMFNHWMRDHTHLWSWDDVDLMWMISHYGFEFPAPDCDGTLIYDAETSLVVSSFINADSAGALVIDYLLHEQPTAGPPPGTMEDYGTQVGQQVFIATEFRNSQVAIAGEMRVKKGKKSRLWLGLASQCAAKGGIAGTNGPSYLMIGPPIGESQPGVRYRIIPD
jgi:hypothetical protein